jgi:Leucine-rich repeat (LRR) protein
MKRRFPNQPTAALAFVLILAPWAQSASADSPFPDKNLEAAIREVLKHEPKVQLTDEKLLDIYFLEAPGKEIKDLTGLEKCKNLALIKLTKNKIADLKPLKDLANLQSLDLAGNEIKDISPLAGLKSLQYIELSGNKIEKIDALKDLTNLNAIYLGNNQIKDLSPLAALNAYDLRLLSSLDASGTPPGAKSLIVVADVSKQLHFRVFDSDGKTVIDTDEKTLAEKGQQIEYTKEQRVQQIEDFKKLLKTLSPPHVLTADEKDQLITAIASIVGHPPLNKLWTLSVPKNQIKDISVLSRITKLQTIDLEDNKIEDTTPLAKQSELKLLMINRNQIKDLKPLVDAAKADSAGPKRFAPYLHVHVAENPLPDKTKADQIKALKDAEVRIDE